MGEGKDPVRLSARSAASVQCAKALPVLCDGVYPAIEDAAAGEDKLVLA
jgi:hypothetical protein